MTKVPRLIPERVLAKDLGVCKRTIIRLEKRDPYFPRVIMLNNRRMYDEDKAIAYRRELIRKAMQEPLPPAA